MYCMLYSLYMLLLQALFSHVVAPDIIIKDDNLSRTILLIALEYRLGQISQKETKASE